jgi:hypothetical protein
MVILQLVIRRLFLENMLVQVSITKEIAESLRKHRFSMDIFNSEDFLSLMT